MKRLMTAAGEASAMLAACLIFTPGHEAQSSPRSPTTAEMAPAILPTGLGESVDRDIERLRAATVRFKAIEEALAAGYKRTDHCVERQPQGGMGLHFNNPALTDITLELDKPEMLVYERLSDGTYQLNGVEYIVPIAQWKQAEPPTIMGQKLKRAESLGIWYLHVWSWGYNPSGVFADWNPRVKC